MEGTEPADPGSTAIATLTAAARALYPHEGLPDAVYARVAAKLAEAARADPAVARLIEDGVAGLDRDRPFASLAADDGHARLQAIEKSPFFELMRSTAVVEVYSDRRTWELVGYEGPSFELGGYLHRGFDDLDWLPDPEAAT